MSDFKRDALVAASRDAIGGEIEVERWKFVWGGIDCGYWRRSGVEFLWRRRSSSRAFLAKESEFYVEVATSEHEGVTTWQCKYNTDSDGSYCRYVFRTPRPRDFYRMSVAARSERKIIGADVARAKPARSMRL